MRVPDLTRAYRNCVKDTGLEFFPFHRLRATAASFLKEHGLTDEEIRVILGHSSARTTQGHYLHPTPDSEARAVSAIQWIFSVSCPVASSRVPN